MTQEKDSKDSSNFKQRLERRPHPPGWVQPKAPYNPYDPADLRPPQGYPSEFDETNKKIFGKIAQDSTDYTKIRFGMKRLEYTPKPPSELYAGRYKILRRVNTNTRFERGSMFGMKLAIWAVGIYGVFFAKWNEYDNVFAPFRRAQLQFRYFLTGTLTKEEMADLYPRQKKLPSRPLSNEAFYDQERRGAKSNYDNEEFILDRPALIHEVEAERVKQMEEERLLRAVDLAEQQVSLKQAKLGEESKHWWKVW
ncbi:unnamed protein product [Kuraishia capsulata CBS 1993]|uniref:Uncharacterized protein n=1 Tax=Kuraishia capsulata CBS 1993 TaxID=1382522 RepID=W6MQ50_9ASCO|nr:uncharacterized protein KUCA_T00004786001 [Kuraishia capsulata CBS 1993]CDK28801.1 unnamed protein product [Kuraishia capsulata CBS 1993]